MALRRVAEVESNGYNANGLRAVVGYDTVSKQYIVRFWNVDGMYLPNADHIDSDRQSALNLARHWCKFGCKDAM